MTETAREIFNEYIDMADGDYPSALWMAVHEIVSLGKAVSAGHVRAKPGKPPALIKPQRPVIDDDWIDTGKDTEGV